MLVVSCVFLDLGLSLHVCCLVEVLSWPNGGLRTLYMWRGITDLTQDSTRLLYLVFVIEHFPERGPEYCQNTASFENMDFLLQIVEDIGVSLFIRTKLNLLFCSFEGQIFWERN